MKQSKSIAYADEKIFFAFIQIVTAAREGHYQKACSLQFAASHKGQEPSTGIINHPNQFYKESVHGPPGSGVAGMATNAKILFFLLMGKLNSLVVEKYFSSVPLTGYCDDI